MILHRTNPQKSILWTHFPHIGTRLPNDKLIKGLDTKVLYVSKTINYTLVESEFIREHYEETRFWICLFGQLMCSRKNNRNTTCLSAHSYSPIIVFSYNLLFPPFLWTFSLNPWFFVEVPFHHCVPYSFFQDCDVVSSSWRHPRQQSFPPSEFGIILNRRPNN